MTTDQHDSGEFHLNSPHEAYLLIPLADAFIGLQGVYAAAFALAEVCKDYVTAMDECTQHDAETHRDQAERWRLVERRFRMVALLDAESPRDGSTPWLPADAPVDQGD